jgi:hypothetical protein
MRPKLARFLLATSGQAFVVGFVLVILLCVWLIRTGGGEDASTALACALFLQMFAAAPGFRAAATRGHYDPFLAGSVSRKRFALTHWSTSTMPGCLCWLVIGLFEWVAHPADVPAAWQPGALAALAVVSTLSWAISLALPRFAGGVLWMAAIFGLFASRTGLLRLRQATVAAHIEGPVDAIASAAFAILFPFALLDESPVARSSAVLLTILIFSVFAFLAGAAYVVWRDYRLGDTT